MFITGPEIIKTVTGEDVTFEELGGAMTHATRSGVAHVVATDEDDLAAQTKLLFSYLPQNNLDDPPRYACDDDPMRENAALDDLVPDSPNKPYDMHEVIEAHSRLRRLLRDPTALRAKHPVRIRSRRGTKRRRGSQPA